MTSKANQNFEVIKIFVESYLVKNHGFKFEHNCLCSNDDLKLIFFLDSNCLVLKSLTSTKEYFIVEIPKDIPSNNCVSFAIKVYGEILKVLRKRKP
ncbi:hypothetical protein MN869_20195 [Acinetobacter sp. NIPH1876]|uniref:hypothetical protein n=1 Tax=Acinetobacter sp. NIPH1876 TaxID=2924041 RepID=UPI00029A80F6|nr:hypothetical protein [Acinetobacter sp. NIPH1876]ENV75474.1 hypothetical protein F944_02579 [Acinetobacter ursingii DSM 16037 = CIP 107286]MCJ0830726.1 hypothetical protein [Acinetobacter sp. NIPH1876]